MAIVKKQSINLYGKQGEIIIKFLKEYGSDEFESDLNSFLKIHLGQLSHEERKTFFDAYGSEFAYCRQLTPQLINSVRKPTFEEYVNDVSRLFFSYILRLVGDFANRPEVPEFFRMIVYVSHGHKRDFIAAHEDSLTAVLRLKTSEPGLIVYALNATHLLYRVFVPFYYTKRFESAYIIKCLNHEFEHYIQQMRGNVQRQTTSKNSLKQQGLNLVALLDEMFWDMMDDGWANFAERTYQQRVLFKGMRALKEFKSRIIKMINQKSLRQAKKYYDDMVDTSQLKYYWAQTMVFTLALYYVVKERKQNFFTFYKENKPFYLGVNQMASSFRKYWSRASAVQMDNLNQDAFLWARNGLNHLYKSKFEIRKHAPLFEEAQNGKQSYDLFIKWYEAACDYFGIREADRILTTRFRSDCFKLAFEADRKRLECAQTKCEKDLKLAA